MTSLRMKERKLQGFIHPLKQPPLGWGKLLESTFSELWNLRGKKKKKKQLRATRRVLNEERLL